MGWDLRQWNFILEYMYATWATCDTKVTFPVLSLVLNMF